MNSVNAASPSSFMYRGPPPSMIVRSDQSRSRGHMSSGKPSSHPIIRAGSGAARSATTSARPFASAPSTRSTTTSRTRSSRDATARGVNRRLTSLRRLACSGLSSPMIAGSAGMFGR